MKGKNMVSVRWIDGSVCEYVSKEDAVEDILESFANTGENPVDDVWEGEEGEEVLLGCSWSLTIDEV